SFRYSREAVPLPATERRQTTGPTIPGVLPRKRTRTLGSRGDAASTASDLFACSFVPTWRVSSSRGIRASRTRDPPFMSNRRYAISVAGVPPNSARCEVSPCEGNALDLQTHGMLRGLKEEPVFAIRGAIQVDEDSPEAIFSAVASLCDGLTRANRLVPSRIVSAIFTLTPDLSSAFPARAAREQGWQDVPMICAGEIPVPDAPPRICRVLVLARGRPQTRPPH